MAVARAEFNTSATCGKALLYMARVQVLTPLAGEGRDWTYDLMRLCVHPSKRNPASSRCFRSVNLNGSTAMGGSADESPNVHVMSWFTLQWQVK